MRTTQAPTGVTAVGRRRALGRLGLFMAVALVVGNMIGSGVFTLPSAMAGVNLTNGAGSLLAWMFTGVGAVMLALVFANLGRAYPRTGGPYVYARRAFGDFIGFQTAWGYWIAAWAGNAAIAVAFVGYLAFFFPVLSETALYGALAGIGVIWLLTLVNVLGVRESGWVQAVTTVLKFVPLLAIGLIGIFFIEGGNYGSFAPNGLGMGDGLLGGVTAAATLTLWAFIGLESATVPAEEVANPERTVPRATVIGTVVTTLVYILATIAVMGVIPAATLQDSASPFAAAAAAIFGGSGYWDDAVALVALVSTFGALNGWILLQGRVPLAAARDGLFPKRFAKVSGRAGTPVFALVVSSLLVTGLMLMNYTKSLVDQFTFILLLATLTTLIPYAYSAAAEMYLLVADRARFQGRRLAIDGGIALLAFAYSVWTIAGAGADIVFKGFMLLMLGIPVYLYMKWRDAKEGRVVVPEAEFQPPTVPTTAPAKPARREPVVV
jgi:APA family basic amino acid/polyamine antiporter